MVLANQYSPATQYYADTHPSIGNDFMLTTGQILTNDDTQTPASFPVSVDNAFITPNGCDDGHDCSLSLADGWLQTNIDPLIKSALFQKDGSSSSYSNENTNGGGQVVAIVISPLAKNGYKSTTLYQHESALHLMLEGLGIKTLPGAAATTPKMWEFFTFAPPRKRMVPLHG